MMELPRVRAKKASIKIIEWCMSPHRESKNFVTDTIEELIVETMYADIEKSVKAFQEFLDIRLASDLTTDHEMIKREYKNWINDFRAVISNEDGTIRKE